MINLVLGNNKIKTCFFVETLKLKDMNELKQMLIYYLCAEYSLDEATQQIEDAEIRIKGKNIEVIYSNGVSEKLVYTAVTKYELVKVL